MNGILRFLTGCFALAGGAVAVANDEPLKVFVFAGQSNMVGKRSQAKELSERFQGEQKNVLMFHDGEWQPYAPGLGEKTGFGPEVSTGLALAEHFGTEIGMIKHSIGGTNLAVQWNPDSAKSLYRTLEKKVSAARVARPIEIVGMFWMQGGADARNEAMAAAYAGNLDGLIAASRRDFGNPEMLFIAGRSGAGGSRYPHSGKVRAAQERQRTGYAWFDCDDLPKGGDGIHYSTMGMEILGARVAKQFLLTSKADK